MVLVPSITYVSFPLVKTIQKSDFSKNTQENKNKIIHQDDLHFFDDEVNERFSSYTSRHIIPKIILFNKNYISEIQKQNKKTNEFIKTKQYQVYFDSCMRCFRAGYGVCIMLTDYAWMYYVRLPYLWKYYPQLSTEEKEHKCHERNSKLLCKLSLLNKGIYVKTGQTIANMSYLFPQEYIDNLQPCLYSTLISSPEDIRFIIQTDLHKNIEDIFDSFDMTPIASASLGQVHKAVLKNGQQVAVKIQHRGLMETAPLDMWFIRMVTKLISIVFPKINYNWFAKEMSHNLPIELDFLNEAQNMEQCREMIKPYNQIVIPTVYNELCSSRCLVMSYEEGIQIDKYDKTKPISSSLLSASDQLISLFLDMVFKYQYMHADPHGGNVLIRDTKKGTQLVLLDHGLYHHLSPDFLNLYTQLISSVANNNFDETHRVLTLIINEGMKQNQEPKLIKKYKNMHLNNNLLNIFITVLADKNLSGESIDYSLDERIQLQKLIYNNLEAVCIYTSLFPIDLGFFVKTFDCLRTIFLPLGMTTKFYGRLYVDCEYHKKEQEYKHIDSYISYYIYSFFNYIYYECSKYVLSWL